MSETISQVEIENDISTIDIDNVSNDFEKAAKYLYNTPDSNSFFQIFSKLPNLIKTLFLFLILNVFLSQINSISANLLTPMVESYLMINKLSSREKINSIKRLPLTIDKVDTQSLRFITGNNVLLRKSHSRKSEIIDEMTLGQVVTVLSKKRNWIEIKYEYDDGEVLQGWVFTRYTAKFKK